MSFLADRCGRPWESEGAPTYLVLEPGENAREAVRQVPAAALVGAWSEPWTSRGVEPPTRSVTKLRRELEKQARQALLEVPRTQLVPISEAAREWAIPERTLRARISRGALEALRNGRGELALEMPVKTPIRIPLPRSMPDQRVLVRMTQAGVAPGQTFPWRLLGDDRERSYRRRRDGESWREASRW